MVAATEPMTQSVERTDYTMSVNDTKTTTQDDLIAIDLTLRQMEHQTAILREKRQAIARDQKEREYSHRGVVRSARPRLAAGPGLRLRGFRRGDQGTGDPARARTRGRS